MIFIKNYLLIGILLCTFFGCKEAPKTILSITLPAKMLKEDFTYFRLILEAVHPGLYQYIDAKKLDKIFDSTYNTLKADATILDFYNSLVPIVNLIRCGHTSIFLPNHFLDSIHRIKGYFPLPLSYINHKLVVNSTDFEIPLGAEIVAINKEPIYSILQKIKKYEPVDGYNSTYQEEEGSWNFSADYFNIKGQQDSFVVKYIADSTLATTQISVDAVTYSQLLKADRYFALPEDVNYNLEMYDEAGYAILTIYTFGYDTWSTDQAFVNFVKNTFRLLQKTPAVRNLIVDLRNNTGGNFHDMFYLYGYLTQKLSWKEFSSAYTVFNRIPFTPYLSKGENDVAGIQASLDSTFSYQRQGRYVRQYKDNETLYPSQYAYKGNLFVITNTNVQSAASYFAALLKDEGRGPIVGDETGGSGSNTNSFHLLTYELPNTHILINVPVVHASFSLQNNKHQIGHGVQPDYQVSFNLNDFKNNNDTQLSFILDSLMR